jgi:serine/threonine protein phosphatase 1
MASASPAESGRLLAIGDIHGCDVALEVLLSELAPRSDDTVVILGDVIDRGPNTNRCLEILLDLGRSCHLIGLLGNHEEMLLSALAGGRWLTSWLQFGGAEMVESYGGDFANVPDAHLDFIRAWRDYYETEREIFAHATPHFDIPMDEQPAEYLRWNRISGTEPPHVSGKRIICGHTAQREGIPLAFQGWVCLDSCAYGPRGALSGMDVNKDIIYQADQRGNFRGEFPLSAFEIDAGGTR